jgi:hypothetical protein
LTSERLKTLLHNGSYAIEKSKIDSQLDTKHRKPVEPITAASTAVKTADVVKDWPLWFFFAIAVSLTVFVAVPMFRDSAPLTYQPFFLLAAIVAWALFVSRASVTGLQAWRLHRSAAEARRKFVITPVDHQCYWAISPQPDGSSVTQITGHFMVKNRTSAPLHLMKARLIRPRIKGAELPGMLSVRSVDSHMHGTAYTSGFFIPPGGTLPAAAAILYRGTPRRKSGVMEAVIEISDADANAERIRLRISYIGAHG